MKKKYHNILSLFAIIITASSMALFFHFLSLKTDFQELNVEHNEVIAKNKDMQVKQIESNDQLIKSAGLIEQSQMEIDRLEKEADILHEQIRDYKKQLEVPKKATSKLPSRGQSSGDWTYYRMTFYDANYQSTGKNPGDKGYGITRSGRKVEEGVTIAVDPNIIPLGTWVLIRWPDGKIEKRRADDTGSAINGYDIDYYVPNATLSMGVETVAVKILGTE